MLSLWRRNHIAWVHYKHRFNKDITPCIELCGPDGGREPYLLIWRLFIDNICPVDLAKIYCQYARLRYHPVDEGTKNHENFHPLLSTNHS